jgi:hypothetical protein
MRNEMRRMIELGILSLLVIFTGCKKDEGPGTGQTDYENLMVQLSNIPDVGLDYSFHAWMQFPNSLGDLGEITPNAQGAANLNWNIGSELLNEAELFYITIEPFDDQDPGPSPWRVLEAAFSGAAGLPNNAPFSNDLPDLAEGTYILATPTTAAPNDEFSGIWFVEWSNNTAQQGLNLPVLDTNWIYEGWVETDGLTLSTGQFSDPSAPDLRNRYISGERPPFPFPGEDFVQALPGISPPDLRGKSSYITIEPRDQNTAPFYLKVLVTDIATDAAARSTQQFLNPGSGQWIQATIKRE